MSIKKLNEEIEQVISEANWTSYADHSLPKGDRDDDEEIELVNHSKVKEWEHNGHKFKEITVDSKEVEVIPGLTIKFNKVEHGQDDVYTRTTWELDRSVNTNAANQAITKHIIQQLGVDDYRMGGWSGAIPLSITTEED